MELLKYKESIAERLDKIKNYREKIIKAIYKIIDDYEIILHKIATLLNKTRDRNKEMMIFGLGHDYHIVSHANTDFLKLNHFRVVTLNMPALTAFGNDYPFPNQLKEILRTRQFGNRDLLMGIQIDKKSDLLAEAYKYNHRQNGINIHISNINANYEYADQVIFIDTDDPFISRDITQILLHFLSVNALYQDKQNVMDNGAKCFSQYAHLLVESINNLKYLNENIIDTSELINKKLSAGSNLFLFGNGGSAALASFFADALHDKFSSPDEIIPSGYNIYDITAYTGSITKSINHGEYQEDVFTRIIRQQGFKRGDILLGISSSGNSANIVHPFNQLTEAVRIAILGFGDGGTIGRNDIKDLAVIIPDYGGYKSYQRAEDGQRIILSLMLTALRLGRH